MGGRAVAASCLSLLGYFPLHIVLQERERGEGWRGRAIGGKKGKKGEGRKSDNVR